MEFHRILESFDRMFSNKNPHPKDDPEKAKQMFKTFIEPCHPFVFLPENADAPKELQVENSEEPLDLPYGCIHIEVLENYITVPNAKDYAIDDMDEFTPSYLGSFIVRETGPKEYFFLLNMYSKSGQPILIEVGKDEKRSKMTYLWMFANSLLKVYLDRLNKEKVGVEMLSGVRKLGEGKNKKFYRLRPITYVSPKKRISEMKPLGGTKEVDWSHRWEVRGHWREVKGIGKDREGNYTIVGSTWVVNHVRGPEEKPIIKKTYIVEKGA